MSSSWTTFHPQGPGRPRSGRGPGGAPLLPAALLARLEPDRAGLRQAQSLAAIRRHAQRRRTVRAASRCFAPDPPPRWYSIGVPLPLVDTSRQDVSLYPSPPAVSRRSTPDGYPLLVGAYVARASARSGFKTASLTRVGPVPVLVHRSKQKIHPFRAAHATLRSAPAMPGPRKSESSERLCALAKLSLRLPRDGRHFAQARSGYHLNHRRAWSAIEQRA
jgi:hypothetical protein